MATEAVFGWIEQPSQPDIHGARAHSTVGQPGGLIFAQCAVVAGCVEKCPAVGFDGKNYVIVYSHAHGCHAYVVGVRMSPQGVVGAPLESPRTEPSLERRSRR